MAVLKLSGLTDGSKKRIRQKWHNNLGEFIYFTELNGQLEFRYIKPNGEVVEEKEVHGFLEKYKPQEFDEVGKEYLNEIIKENT